MTQSRNAVLRIKEAASDELLAAENRKVAQLTFVIPESIAWAYTHNFNAINVVHQTHAMMHLWRGGSFGDISLSLDVVAGVSPGVDSPSDIIRMVERLIEMSLPHPNLLQLRRTTPPDAEENEQQNTTSLKIINGVTVEIGGGQRVWLKQNCFIKSISPTYKAPYDIDTGEPLHAIIGLVLTPTFAFPPITTQSALTTAQADAFRESQGIQQGTPMRGFRFAYQRTE